MGDVPLLDVRSSNKNVLNGIGNFLVHPKREVGTFIDLKYKVVNIEREK